jgi:hypothetical protein
MRMIMMNGTETPYMARIAGSEPFLVIDGEAYPYDSERGLCFTRAEVDWQDPMPGLYAIPPGCIVVDCVPDGEGEDLKPWESLERVYFRRCESEEEEERVERAGEGWRPAEDGEKTDDDDWSVYCDNTPGSFATIGDLVGGLR